MTPPQPGPHGPSLHPVGRAPTAIELAVLREETDIVAGADGAREVDVPIREEGVAPQGLTMSELEEVQDAFACDADHEGRAPAATAPAHSVCGL